MTDAEADTRRRHLWDFADANRWYVDAYVRASDRYGHNIPIRVAVEGSHPHVHAMAWTETDYGTIYLREGIFEGLDLTNVLHASARNGVLEDLKNGIIIGEVTHPRAGMTVAAAFGAMGHEILHAAYSEHTLRDPWHLMLEDIRIESLWMATDPIRARQVLRACAAYWVVGRSSPMMGDPVLDPEILQTTADALQMYLLVVGRARIGVLDENSAMVRTVREIVVEILGWATCSDADDILDRYCETDPSPVMPEAAEERRLLAEEMARLLPGSPTPGAGCGCVVVINGDPPKEVSPGEASGEGGSDDGEGAPEPGTAVGADGEALGEGGDESIVGVTPDGGAGSAPPEEHDPEWLTGKHGGDQDKSQHEAMETKGPDSEDAQRLTPEQAQALADALSQGLVAIETSGEWMMTEAEEHHYLLRTLITPKAAADQVFGPGAKVAHAQRISETTRR